MTGRIQGFQDEPSRDLFEELHELITARFTEQITLEQLKRLEELVLHDEEARQIYVLYVHDLANLRRMLRADEANAKQPGERELESLRESVLARRLNARGKRAAIIAETDDAPAAHTLPVAKLRTDTETEPEIGKRKSGPSPRTGWKAAGIALLVGGIVAAIAMLRPAPVTPELPATESVLAEELDAAWEDDQGMPVSIPAGQPLGPRKLRLVRGVATIQVGKDTLVLLDGREAATSFEIRPDGGGLLHMGRLTLRSRPNAPAYAISLPGNIRLAHGTEFGVVVDDDGRSEVHAITGSIEATRIGTDGASGGRTMIAPGNAVVVKPASRIAPIEIEELVFDRAQFLRQEDDQTLADATRASESAQQRAWKKYAAELREDAALAYYFDGASSGLPDDRLTPGRFGERAAVSFWRAGDQIVVDDNPSLRLEQELTVAVWLNPDRARTQGFALIVGKGTGGGGNVAQENRNYTLFLAPTANGQPRFEFSINEQGTDDNRHIQAGVVGARQWHLVVGVVRQGRMYLYCNGRLAADPLSIKGPKVSDEPLLIGRSQHPQIQSPFQGAIDMIAILSRGMTDAEIQAMYLAGRP